MEGEPIYEFVRGKGWVPEDPYPIPIIDQRTTDSAWCKFEIRSRKGDYGNQWVEEWKHRRWTGLDEIKKSVLRYADYAGWDSRIVLIDKDEHCGRVW